MGLSFDFTAEARASGLYPAPPGWLAIACATTGRAVRTGLSSVVSGIGANAWRARSVDGTTAGLLVEMARTNICLQSQTLGTGWAGTNASVTSDVATAAPDVTTTADKIVEAVSASTQHRIDQSIASITNGGTYTMSAWMRAVERSAGELRWLSFTASFDLVNLVSTQGEISGTANGWCICSKSATSGVTSSTARVNTESPYTGQNYAGDGTSGLLVWGTQIETGLYPGSYIATTTGNVTRAADVLTANSALFLPRGYFHRRLVIAPLYANTEQAADHDIEFIDASNHVYIQQSTGKVTFVCGGTTLQSGALTWSRDQAITVEYMNSPKTGMRLAVNGGAPVTSAAVAAVTLPASVVLLGGASTQESAALRSIVSFNPFYRESELARAA